MARDRWMSRGRIGASYDSVLRAAQSGAPWALGRLYQTLSPAVVGYLRVQGVADPEDLTNEVFLGVIRGISSFEGNEERFRSWIFTIAHSRLVDERRRADRRPQLAGNDPEAHLDRVAGDAEKDALDLLSSQRVPALCELVPDQRDVLLLRLMAVSPSRRSPTPWASPRGRSRPCSAGGWPLSAEFSTVTPYPNDALGR